MILTKKFLQDTDACTEGYRAVLDLNLLGQDYDVATSSLAQNNYSDYAEWLNEQKTTEAYVRANGTEFTMGSYQVFNPLTGQHIECADEASARQTIIDVSNQLLDTYKISLIQSMTNENGDQTWITTQLSSPIVLS